MPGEAAFSIIIFLAMLAFAAIAALRVMSFSTVEIFWDTNTAVLKRNIGNRVCSKSTYDLKQMDLVLAHVKFPGVSIKPYHRNLLSFVFSDGKTIMLAACKDDRIDNEISKFPHELRGELQIVDQVLMIAPYPLL